MAGVEVYLFDAGRGLLTPVGEGAAIRIHTCLPERLAGEPVELGSMRPFGLYELLRRVLEREGLLVRFVSHPREDGDTMFERVGERALREAPDPSLCPSARVETPEPSGGEAERCIDLVLSGAEGPVERSSHTVRSRLKFRDAQAEFGYPALVLYLLGAHYSQPLDDPLSGLPEARARAERIREVAATLRAGEPSPPEMRDHLSAFRLSLARDLDTPSALRALFDWLREAELCEEPVGDSDLREMLALLELEELEELVED